MVSPVTANETNRTAIAFVDDSDFFTNGKNSEMYIQKIADKYVRLYEGGTGGKIKQESVAYTIIYSEIISFIFPFLKGFLNERTKDQFRFSTRNLQYFKNFHFKICTIPYFMSVLTIENRAKNFKKILFSVYHKIAKRFYNMTL